MRIFLLPYRKGSETIGALAEHLQIPCIRYENSKYKPRQDDLVINWGNSNPTVPLPDHVLNKPEFVSVCSNKLVFFRTISNFDIENKPRVPDWTQSKDEALSWINSNEKIFVRTKLTGNSGEGIVIVTTPEELEEFNNGSLFVKYVKKKHEYRLHFFKNEIFDVQKKSKRNDVEDVNWFIRSHDNGFVFTRNNIDVVPEDVLEQGNRLIKILNLDFGAIDVIYNEWHQKAYILEVNTAPGLEGTTLENYVTKFRGYIDNV